MTPDSAPEPPLVATTRPRPEQPLLVAGPGGAAILSADGSFCLPWDTRGAPLEWGGVYAQGVRLCGPWSVAVGSAGAVTPLGPATLRSLRHWRWGVETVHELAGLRIVDELFAITGVPGVGRQLTVARTGPGPDEVRVECEVPLALAPVLIEGVQPHDFELRTRDTSVRAAAHGSALCVESEPLPSLLAVDGSPWIGGRRAGPAQAVRFAYDLAVPAEGASTLAWVLWGGLESTVEGSGRAGRAALDSREAWRGSASALWQAWAASIPCLETPDDPVLSSGYRLAAGALRALYSDPEPGMHGLVAGYPWYSALWFRDIGWMLPAVLWLGDVDRVVATLGTAFRFQAPRTLALLGGTAGELPMQLSPGPIFLYGTSDTTLYYPGIVRRLVRHTGDPSIADPYPGGLASILDWATGKLDATSGLFTNGGEVEVMKQKADELGRVQYGIDAFDTTIWDSADRRDHAVDIQVLWWECLDALADLERIRGGSRTAELEGRAATARRAVADRYRWPEQRYLVDSILRSGIRREQVRPNALRAVAAGLLDDATARAVSERADEGDLSTAWGLRTLSSADPSYDPLAYHEGQVWPIATAWAAAAAFRTGRVDAGVHYLDLLAGQIVHENGYANECYRGDAPTAFDSCFLLGFSVAPFLTTVFEGLWGLTPRLHGRTVECRPNFPAAWRSAALLGLKLGGGTLDLRWTEGEIRARWDGPWPLTFTGDHGSVELAPGGSGTLPRSAPTPPS
ncbi:MAG TPA: amylo-alpha-1,6-glucosidase [Thermoplasmata archaeon]|nr:amylo-alpha-1,6-glucosidase [Thermoplasmata archaeon]